MNYLHDCTSGRASRSDLVSECSLNYEGKLNSQDVVVTSIFCQEVFCDIDSVSKDGLEVMHLFIDRDMLHEQSMCRKRNAINIYIELK